MGSLSEQAAGEEPIQAAWMYLKITIIKTKGRKEAASASFLPFHYYLPSACNNNGGFHLDDAAC
jgi:hypothetical protein